MKKIIAIILILVLMLLILTACHTQKQENRKIQIVTSFYPMYIITQNIVQGISDVELKNMTSQNVGCLHDYTLTTADLMKIEIADIFIINGLGIENFTEKIAENYKETKIINASSGIENLINNENAHIWLDIDKYIKQVENIANELSKINQANAEQYKENGQLYKNKLEVLKILIEENTKQRKKCISFSESLAYLTNSMNLEMKIVKTDHEQNGLSAEMLSNAIEYVKENNIKNILIDKKTADNNAQIIASETGATIYVLDSGLTGSGSIDDYINIMKENLEQVKKMEE